jgi:hypothetical protein
MATASVLKSCGGGRMLRPSICLLLDSIGSYINPVPQLLPGRTLSLTSNRPSYHNPRNSCLNTLNCR